MKEDNHVLNIPHHTPPPVTLPSTASSNANTILLNKIQMQVNGASNPTTAATNGNGAQTNKGGYKIVVNNYHALSIRSNQESNNIATCLINTPSLDGRTKLYQQIGDAPMPMPTSKHKNVDTFISANLERSKSKASKDQELEIIQDVASNENSASPEESSIPNETSPPPPPKSVIVIQTSPQKCEAAGEDDVGSNLDDDDDEDLGGEFVWYTYLLFSDCLLLIQCLWYSLSYNWGKD